MLSATGAFNLSGGGKNRFASVSGSYEEEDSVRDSAQAIAFSLSTL